MNSEPASLRWKDPFISLEWHCHGWKWTKYSYQSETGTFHFGAKIGRKKCES